MSASRHITTRRGFIAGMGFAGVSLYGLWVAYGAAPGPLALLGGGGVHGHEGEGGGHGAGSGAGGHGAMTSGPTVEEFRRQTAEFVERYRLPDGSVHPRMAGPADAATPAAPAAQGTTAMPHDAPAMHGATHGTGDGASAAAGTAAHGMSPAGHGAADGAAGGTQDAGAMHGAGPAHGDTHAPATGHAGTVLPEIPLLAEKWFFEPAHLRLDAGTIYRFRMMATDVSHGASIQLGRGSRMIRLRPGQMAEMEARFTRPGRYLVYCTLYCGEGHDVMQARIDVA